MADFPVGSSAYSFSSDIGTVSSGVAVVTSGALINTMGAIVELIASTEAESNSITVTIPLMVLTGGNQTEMLYDILIGASGFEEMLIEGLYVTTDNATNQLTWKSNKIPLSIPVGSRISAQAQASLGLSNQLRMIAKFNAISFESPQGYGQCISHGVDTATSSSTIVIDPGAVLNTLGSWVEIASTTDGYKGFFLCFGSNGNTAQANINWLVDIGIGGVGSEEVIASAMALYSNTQERSAQDEGFINIEIPAGVRVAVRAQANSTDATDRLRTLIFHGVR